MLKRTRIVVFALFALAFCATAVAQEKVFTLDAKQTTVRFTLDSSLHTVHGNFALKQGSLRVDPGSGRMTGQIVVDAKSGDSGNGLRDRKMHGQILESDQYPEITFQPSQMDGVLAPDGKSTVQIHGMFGLHGVTHEISVPATVTIGAGKWTATLSFHVPYVKWGLKNPSTLFLHADESVEIEMNAAGTTP